MKEEERVSIGSDASFFYSIAIGVIATIVVFRFQENTLYAAISHFQLVVALGGGGGLIARWMSDASDNKFVKKLAVFLMNISCSTIGIVFTMLYYIAKG